MQSMKKMFDFDKLEARNTGKTTWWTHKTHDLQFGANSILKKKLESGVFLNSQNTNDCISETHLITQSYIKVKGYKVYHTTHPDNVAKDGSAVIIKYSINH